MKGIFFAIAHHQIEPFIERILGKATLRQDLTITG